VVVDEAQLTERGGLVWAFSPDGERALYSDAFRRQLQATDARGFGLAVQLTDQEETKDWASWSPDEEWLAWTTGNNGGRLWIQKTHYSGTHLGTLAADNGHLLRRTTWSPDGRLLLVTDWDLNTRLPKLRCWDMAAGAERKPPAPFDQAGLGDLDWRADGSGIATFNTADGQAVVLVAPEGTLRLLRPMAPAGTYVAPAVDPRVTRVVAYDENRETLALAPADGGEDGAVALLSPAAGRRALGAVWSSRGDRVAASVAGEMPEVLTLGGCEPPTPLVVAVNPPTARGERPATFRFSARASRLKVTLRAAVVADDGAESGVVTADLGRQVAVTPEAATPGPHWLKVEVTRGARPDPLRWYRYVIVPATGA